MLPWHYKTQKYGSFWRMNSGEKRYKVYFFEQDDNPYSCKDKFPITLSTGQTLTKDEFVLLVQESLEQFNSYNVGITLTYDGYDVTDKDDLAFNTKDGYSAIVYYWKYKWGGLSAPFGKDDFGIKAYLGDKLRREWYIGVLRHELTHALGFAHKQGLFLSGDINTMPIITGLKKQGEIAEDTVHGVKVVYDIHTKYNLSGIIFNINEIEAGAEAFLIANKTKQFVYQSPADSTGYFEFRLDKPLKKFKLLVVAKEKESGKYLYSTIWKLPRKMGYFNRKFYFPNVVLENKVDTIQEILNNLK